MIVYYCINRRTDIERRRKMEKIAGKRAIAINFVEAVEGCDINYDLSEKYGYNRRNRKKIFNDLEKNEIACVLSHKKALELHLKSPHEYCVIFEDDAFVSKDFKRILDILTHSITGWDIIKLESRTEHPRGLKIARIDTRHHLIAPFKGSFGATGILYSRDGARKILQSLSEFTHAYDTHIGFCWRYGIYMAEITPSIVYERNDDVSTIGGRATNKRRPGLSAWLHARIERVQHSLMKRVFAFHTRSVIRYIQPKCTASG